MKASGPNPNREILENEFARPSPTQEGARRHWDSSRDATSDGPILSRMGSNSAGATPQKLFDLQALLIRIMEECRTSLAGRDRLRIFATLHSGLRITAGEALAVVYAVTGIIGNAVEHSHPDGTPVGIAITCLSERGNIIAVEVADDGVGFPHGFEEWRDAGRGIMSIRLALQRIDARLDITSEDAGVRFQIRLRAS